MRTASCARTHASPRGKIAVPDAVLLKDGELDPYEARVMRKHPIVGDSLCAGLRSLNRVRPIVLEALRRGKKVALVSDAGTPLVSDPGFKLVRDALANNLPVTAVPGPSAALTALILSGLPPEVFLFAGFLPPRSGARRRMLAQWAKLVATLVFFEGPSRLAASLSDMAEILSDRNVAVARELTKRYEEVRRGRLSALAEHYREAGPPRGEVAADAGGAH